MLIHYSDPTEADVREDMAKDFPDGKGGIAHGGISMYHNKNMMIMLKIKNMCGNLENALELLLKMKEVND